MKLKISLDTKLDNKIMGIYLLLINNVSNEEDIEQYIIRENFFDDVIKAKSKNQVDFQKRFEYMEKGIFLLEETRTHLNKNSFFELPYHIRAYALRHFNIDSRPGKYIFGEEEGVEQTLKEIDKDVLPFIGVDSFDISSEDLFLTNFRSIAVENEGKFFNNNHIVTVNTDVIVKYVSSEHKTYEIDIKNGSNEKVIDGKAQATLVSVGMKGCSAIILDDTKNKNIYMIHIQPINNWGDDFLIKVSDFLSKEFIDELSVNVTIIYGINDFGNFKKLIDPKYIANKKEFYFIELVDEEMKDLHKNVYYRPREGKLIISPTQNGLSTELPILLSPTTISLPSSVTKNMRNSFQFFNQPEYTRVESSAESSHGPVCLPPMP